VTLEQVGLQLGIAGLLVVVGYRLAVLLIDRWQTTQATQTAAFAEAERDRTRALTIGLTSISDRVQTHAIADIQSHAEIVDRISRFEGKLDATLDWQERTPINAPIPSGLRPAAPSPIGREITRPTPRPPSLRAAAGKPDK
jgi:hypothetical protein